jgi:hypothetical protein
MVDKLRVVHPTRRVFQRRVDDAFFIHRWARLSGLLAGHRILCRTNYSYAFLAIDLGNISVALTCDGCCMILFFHFSIFPFFHFSIFPFFHLLALSRSHPKSFGHLKFEENFLYFLFSLSRVQNFLNMTYEFSLANDEF